MMIRGIGGTGHRIGGKLMKLSFSSTVSLYVLVRLALCTITICVFIFGICPFITITAVKTISVILFSTAMCIFTAITISRYVRMLIARPLKNLLDSAELLAKASLAMNAAAKGIDVNSGLMVDFADKLNMMAELCDGIRTGNIDTTNIVQSSESDGKDRKNK